MADTTTPNIKLTNQTEGANNNSWGTIADANFEEIDDKFGDQTSISTTGGDTTLTDSQEIVAIVKVTGTLVSNATITFSGRGGTWVIRNATTGNYSVTCKLSGSDGTEIAQGTQQTVYCDGSDILPAGATSNATNIPTGSLQAYLLGTAPSGWVLANGTTIGNASSNSSQRANADTEDLFVSLWDNFSNTLLPIYDSAGSATSRGASGAADFAANKRLTLPDLRGRAFFGVDNMGSTAAGRLGAVITNDTTLGATGGTETNTISEANLPAHTHGMNSHTHSFSATTSSGGEHTHTFSGTTGNNSVSHTHNISASTLSVALTGAGTSIYVASGTTTTTTQSDNHTHTYSGTTSGISVNHSHTVSGTSGAASGNTGSTGSGTAISNLPPAYLGSWLIKL